MTATAAALQPTQAASEALLTVADLSCAFGGLLAVDKVSFAVPQGAVVSLIGPNGAGKTTLFNCVTGINRQFSGRVLLDGENLAGRKPHEVMQKGIARTFQAIRLFNEMTALENAMAGQHCRTRAGLLPSVLHSPGQRAEERRIVQEALRAIEFVGLRSNVNQLSRTLAYGEKRRLEIARALASYPRLMLLDEPAAGMNESETVELVEVIRKVRDSGVTVLLIEHQMRLVMDISDYVFVLDQGRLIAEGPPAQVQNDPAVMAAYLGTAEE